MVIIQKKSFARSVGEGLIAYTSTKVLTQVVNMVSALIVIRALSVFEYGVWQLVQSAGAIIGMLALPTLENIFITDMARDLGENNPGRYKAELLSFSKIIFPLNIIVGITLFFSAGIVASWIGNDAAIPVIKIFSLTFFLAPIKRVYLLLFLTKAKFTNEAVFQFLNRLGYMLLVLLLVWGYGYGFYGVALAYVLSVLLPLLAYLPVFIKSFSETFSVSLGQYSIYSTLNAHGKWSILNDQTGITGNIEPWIIKYLLGVEAVALFSVAMTLFSAIADVVPLEKIFRSLFPFDIPDERIFAVHFERSIKYFTWLYAIIAVGAFLFVPPFLRFAFPHYLPSLVLFNIIILRFLVLPMGQVVGAALYTFRAQKVMFIINSVKIIFPLALAASIYFFGLIGIAVYSVVMSYVLTLGIRYYALKKIAPFLSMRLKSLFIIDSEDYQFFRRSVKPYFV